MIAPLACVVPAYNAASTLADVLHELRVALPHAAVIVVDDGSEDATHAIACATGARVLSFERNRGKGAALRAAFAEALALGVSAVLTMDADGQHDGRYAPAVLDALACADVAIGTRARDHGAMPLGRRLTNALASFAVGSIVGVPIADAQSGFRAIRRRVLEHVHAHGERYEFETDFLIQAGRAGYRIASVPIPTIYGTPSHFRVVRDSVRVVQTIWRGRCRAAQ